MMVRGRWVVALTLVGGCSEPSAPTPAAAIEAPPGPQMDHGRPGPAPQSEVAYARAVVDALSRSDWEGYTNLLATRADMFGVYADSDRGSQRKRRNRRRMVWRRINALRGGDAEEGWAATLREARNRSLPLAEAKLHDVRRVEVEDRRLPTSTAAARLIAVLEHGGSTHWLDLGTCVRSKRGWVALYPMTLRAGDDEPPGEGLLIAEDPAP